MDQNLPKHMKERSLSMNDRIKYIQCPDCGSPMVRRARKVDGAHFYGCSAFPACRGIRAAKEVDNFLDHLTAGNATMLSGSPVGVQHRNINPRGGVEIPTLDDVLQDDKNPNFPKLVYLSTVPEELLLSFDIKEGEIGVAESQNGDTVSITFSDCNLIVSAPYVKEVRETDDITLESLSGIVSWDGSVPYKDVDGIWSFRIRGVASVLGSLGSISLNKRPMLHKIPANPPSLSTIKEKLKKEPSGIETLSGAEFEKIIKQRTSVPTHLPEAYKVSPETNTCDTEVSFPDRSEPVLVPKNPHAPEASLPSIKDLGWHEDDEFDL